MRSPSSTARRQADRAERPGRGRRTGPEPPREPARRGPARGERDHYSPAVPAASFLEQHLTGGTWRADPPFSSVTFKVRHLGARDYRAGFKEIDATLDVAAGTLAASVPVASLDLNNPIIRTRMLSSEFLDADRFPDVTFVVSDFRGDGTRAIVVPGELTIHGHTCPVEATGKIGLPGPGLLSPGNRVGIELCAIVDRRDFGLDWQEQLPGGGITLGYDVTLEAVLEFVELER
jgi:polyisoprenoid-binding protein YceI